MACDGFNSIKNWWHNSNYVLYELLSLFYYFWQIYSVCGKHSVLKILHFLNISVSSCKKHCPNNAHSYKVA